MLLPSTFVLLSCQGLRMPGHCVGVSLQPWPLASADAPSCYRCYQRMSGLEPSGQPSKRKRKLNSGSRLVLTYSSRRLICGYAA